MAGYFLSLIGGSLTLLVGAATIEAWTNLSSLTVYPELSPAAGPILAAGVATLIAGAIISICGATIYRKPNWHVPLGAVVIIMSLSSWFGTINLLSTVRSPIGPLVPYAAIGLEGSLLALVQVGVLGLPLSLVGGILVLVWRTPETRRS